MLKIMPGTISFWKILYIHTHFATEERKLRFRATATINGIGSVLGNISVLCLAVSRVARYFSNTFLTRRKWSIVQRQYRNPGFRSYRFQTYLTFQSFALDIWIQCYLKGFRTASSKAFLNFSKALCFSKRYYASFRVVE